MTIPQHPGLIRRLAAIVYDVSLILPLIMLVVAITMGAQALFKSLTGGSAEAALLQPLLVQLLALITSICFYTGFWRIKGQTLGMQAWRLKLLSENAATPTVTQCVSRCLYAIVSLLPLGLGYWWCLFDKQGLCWHDRWSKTQLVLLPKAADKSI